MAASVKTASLPAFLDFSGLFGGPSCRQRQCLDLLWSIHGRGHSILLLHILGEVGRLKQAFAWRNRMRYGFVGEQHPFFTAVESSLQLCFAFLVLLIFEFTKYCFVCYHRVVKLLIRV